ncbi:MAG: glycoside hydrolase family 127 protein [Kiritimatiellae bacterium]|nr:glycoside hydrolase family 127 protein [Kiritimatiellia bacterium]
MTPLLLSFALPLCAPAPLPPGDTELTGGVFLERRATDAEYLLEVVDPDRLLSEFRRIAGLEPKAPRYPNRWEGGGINGHSLGHYLSAVSALCAVSRDPGEKAAAKAKVDYIVSELKACQDANADGYVMTVPKRIYGKVKSGDFTAGGFDINGWWVPNYTLHKVFAGLRDAYRLAGSADALEIERKLGDWYISVAGGLDDAKLQKLLRSEWGGLNETFAQLYEDTGERRFLDAAERLFDDRGIFGPLKRGEDRLDGKHANTQVPKIVGLALLYDLTGKPEYRKAVETFWDSVTGKRSFANGGHSDEEHFYCVEQSAEKLGPHNCETCNINNMHRLAKYVFSWKPDSKVMDYVERGLLNQLLANIGRKPGEFGYFLSQAPVAEKAFSTPEGAWWCCVGTGMENPMHYADHAYSVAGDVLYVNLFMPTRARACGWRVEQKTRFPEGEGTDISFEPEGPGAKPLRVKIRRPYWCAKMEIDGRAAEPGEDGYASFVLEPRGRRLIRVSLPMNWHAEELPFSCGSRVAFMYGPSVMAATTPPQKGRPDMAKRRWDDHLAAPAMTDEPGPVIAADSEAEAIEAFKALPHMPLWQVYEEHYSVYPRVMSKREWAAKRLQLAHEEAERRESTAMTVDEVMPGFQQSEVNHDFEGRGSEAGDFRDRKYRHALGPGGSFSYRLACEEGAELSVTYWSGDGRGRVFDIFADGELIATERMKALPGEGRFYEKKYAVPSAILRGKKSVEIRFSGRAGTEFVGGVFGVKILRRRR